MTQQQRAGSSWGQQDSAGAQTQTGFGQAENSYGNSGGQGGYGSGSYGGSGGYGNQGGQGGYGSGSYGNSGGYGNQGGQGGYGSGSYGNSGGQGGGSFGGGGGGQGPSQPGKPAKRGGKGGIAAAITGGLLAGLLAGGAGGVGAYYALDNNDGGSSASQTTGDGGDGTDAKPVNNPGDGIVSQVAEQTGPKVVSLQVDAGGQSGSGSGFVVSEDGYIATNAHVVQAAEGGGEITAVMSDGTRFPAKIHALSKSYDVAVVKIDPGDTKLQPIEWGDSDSLVVGEDVLAFGAPFGLESTVTNGIVSAMNRPVSPGGGGDDSNTWINAVQTDAPINPGNSGGPLVDLEGKVIGINSAIYSPPSVLGGQSGSVGLGFSIPSNDAQRVVKELIEKKKAPVPIIGAMIDMGTKERGAKISSGQGGNPGITPDGPAAKAGLKEGDLITSLGDKRINSPSELIAQLRSYAVGDKVKIKYQRGGGGEQEVEVTLAEGSSD